MCKERNKHENSKTCQDSHTQQQKAVVGDICCQFRHGDLINKGEPQAVNGMPGQEIFHTPYCKRCVSSNGRGNSCR